MSDDHTCVTMREQRYRVERFWGVLPSGVQFGLVSTLAVTSDGAVVVSQRGGAAVLVFSAEGAFLDTWGDDVIDAHGINVDHNDRIILVDRDAHEIQFRALDGSRLGGLGNRHRPRYQAPFNHPTSAFVTRDGECYVADGYGNSVVHRFAADGAHVSTWGSPGSGPGEFSTPHSIWVDQQDRVLVADRENNRIQVFDRAGTYITSWADFYHPMDISEDSAGFIYVSDQIPRLSQLDSDGRLVGRCRPVWNTPHGVACGPDGVIYLTEMNPASLVKLSPVAD
jgi:DNA-binding beta-propeller fold protein YncE